MRRLRKKELALPLQLAIWEDPSLPEAAVAIAHGRRAWTEIITALDAASTNHDDFIEPLIERIVAADGLARLHFASRVISLQVKELESREGGFGQSPLLGIDAGLLHRLIQRHQALHPDEKKSYAGATSASGQKPVRTSTSTTSTTTSSTPSSTVKSPNTSSPSTQPSLLDEVEGETDDAKARSRLFCNFCKGKDHP